MKKLSIILLGAATLAFGACSSKRNSDESYRQPSTLPVDKPITTPTLPPAPSADQVDDLQAERDALIEKTAARLDAIDRQIATFEAQVMAEMSTDPGSTRMEMVRKLKETRAEAADAFEKAKAAGRESWGDARTTMDAAFDKLDRAYDEAVADMKR